jgi:hypothetical protein
VVTKDEALEIAEAECERREYRHGPAHSVYGVLRYTIAFDREPIGSTVFVRVSRRTGKVLGWFDAPWPRRRSDPPRLRRWERPSSADR